METTIRPIIAKLAEKYGFDATEAYEFVSAKDTADAGSSVSATSDVPDKIAVCEKNIALWQKKLDEGKVKDADKQREKIEKEKAKLGRLNAKLPKPALEPVAPPKKEEPVKKTAPKKDEPKKEEKRIARISPAMASQLKDALKPHGIDLDDKIKKEFRDYIENLSDDDYRTEGLADHMRAFAKTKAPAMSAAGGKMPDVDPSKVQTLTLDQLQAIKMTATLDETPGTYWDADTGRFVSGPEAEDDEDFTEVKFQSKAYVVGEKTGRVYEARDSGDVFAGFIGVGKFKTMKA
jgi:hypothetical protein